MPAALRVSTHLTLPQTALHVRLARQILTVCHRVLVLAAPVALTRRWAFLAIALLVLLARLTLTAIRQPTAPTAWPAILAQLTALAHACPALLARPMLMAIPPLAALCARQALLFLRLHLGPVHNFCAPMAQLTLMRTLLPLVWAALLEAILLRRPRVPAPSALLVLPMSTATLPRRAPSARQARTHLVMSPRARSACLAQPILTQTPAHLASIAALSSFRVSRSRRCVCP